MNPRSEPFFIKTLPSVLKQCKAKLFIYQCVTKEINDHVDSNEPDTRRDAQQAASIVKNLTTQQVTELVETKEEFADFVLYNEIARLRKDHNIALITQDRNLSHDVLGLNNIQSSQFNTDIQVYCINHAGHLMSWVNTRHFYDEIKPLTKPGKLPRLSIAKDNIPVLRPVPASSPVKAIEIPKHPDVPISLPEISHINKAAVKKSKGGSSTLVRRRPVKTLTLGNPYSTNLRQSQKNNYIERLMRSVSEIFRHQGSEVGSYR